jgi:hypothetical protein
MRAIIKIAIAAGASTLAALSVWGACGLTRHVIIAVDRWGSAAPTYGKIDAVLDHLNRPCKGASGPDACGTLAQINKTAIDAGDAIVRTQLIERTAQPHIVAAMDEFGQTAKHLSSTADSLSGTAHSATRTLDAATDTIGEGKRTIAAAQPLLSQLTANGASLQATTDTLNDTLKRKAVGETLDNLAGITGHADALMDDGQRVGDDLTRRYFAPVPWYKKVGPFAEFGVKAGNKALGLW